MKPKTAMEITERPILFSTPMVKAILEGRKTQTRRVLKVPKSLGEFRDVFDDEVLTLKSGKAVIGIDTSIYHDVALACPYGTVGDRLWVRETWQNECDGDGQFVQYLYKADGQDLSDYVSLDADIVGIKWRPSIFMPREASRITLEITNIRVERLQDISEADAIAEGCYSKLDYAKNQFQYLWNLINNKRGFGWTANPFVWVIEFKKL